MSDLMDAPRPPPSGKGSAESAAEFRALLEEVGKSQTELARWMKRMGDDRQPGTILRNVQRMATGEARVSGEMRVILALLRNGARKRAQREEAAQPEA